MSSLTPLVRKPAQKESSLTRLRQASRQLFVRQGYHVTRPQDIARQAGVANGTFYLHFADKQQAFLDFADQAQQELLGELDQKMTGASRQSRWESVCGAIVDFGAAHPGLLQAAFVDPVFVAPANDSAWQTYDRLGDLMARLLEREGVNDEYDLELMSHGICGLLRHAMIYAGRRDVDREKLIQNLGRFIDKGLD